MFDKLVESAKQKQGKHARWFFLATGVIYTVALAAFGVIAIIGFNPALAEEYDDVITCMLPHPDNTQHLPVKPNAKSVPIHGFVTPPYPIVDILPPDQLKDLSFVPRVLVHGAPGWTGVGRGDGTFGAPDTNEPPPPPPPTPVTKPAATPTPDPVVRLTSTLTQGRALRKAQPPYPTIARQVKAQGSVQIQISISESGEVTDAIVLSGHPLLRDAALQAAKQWLFQPTELNGRPVRAIGVITFNFILN
ncbi:MAG: energy transducer TonB [Blastocatellia bacterium]